MKRIAKFFVRIYNSYLLEEECRRRETYLQGRIRMLENLVLTSKGYKIQGMHPGMVDSEALLIKHQREEEEKTRRTFLNFLRTGNV